ncbi:MAG: carboxypeptidase-like regulatory domain-containing protein [Bacteroidota bacterium]
MSKYLLAFILLCGSVSLWAQTGRYQLKVEDRALEEVIKDLENRYQLLFSYKEKDVKEVSITADIDRDLLRAFFQQLLQKTDLQFEIVDSNYIILTRKKKAPKQLSETKKEPRILPLLCGTIIDSITRDPLPAASIYIERSQRGVYSAADGRFQLRSALAPDDMLVISFVGYQEKRLPARTFVDSNCPLIQLRYLDFGEDFIVVTDYLTDGVDLGDKGAATLLRPGRVGALPGQAEPDVLSTIQLLPGISSPDGEASGIYIRGGTPDQNLILWEDIPIYHSAHYFGMISAFNPYITDKVEVYRGGFGADYGARVSGVIDMKSPDTSLPESNFGAGSNFINAYTYGKLSLLNNNVAFTYSLRRSLGELWQSPTFENIDERNEQGLILGDQSLSQLPDHITVNNDFNFFDAHFKVAARLSERDELSAAYFYGNNEFEDVIRDNRVEVEQRDTLNLDNWGASLTWKRNWSEQWESKLVGLRTRYILDYQFLMQDFQINTSERSGGKDNQVEEQQIHFSNRFKMKKGVTLKAGYHFTHYDFSYQLTEQIRDLPPISEEQARRSSLHTGYVELSTSKEKKMGADLGLRFSHYQRNQTNYWEPRLRLWYEINPELRLHASAGKYHQFLGQLLEFKGNEAGINVPIWVLAGTNQVPVQGANQYQIGGVYHKKSWVVDLQVYYKDIDGLTSRATGFDGLPQGKFVMGMTRIKGIDLLVKKRWNNFRTWISYSLSEANYFFESFIDPEFAAPFDQRHLLSWVNLWKYKDFEFSLGLTLQSGKPYSVMDRIDVRQDPMGRRTAHAIYDDYNDTRLPLQHFLNASVLYNFYPKNGDKWKGVLGLSFYNIYNTTNVYSRDYYIAGRRNQPFRIDSFDKVGLGFTPNAVIRIEW